MPQGLIDNTAAGADGIKVVTVPRINPNDDEGGSDGDSGDKGDGSGIVSAVIILFVAFAVSVPTVIILLKKRKQ